MDKQTTPRKPMISIISPFYNEGGKNAAGIAQYFDTMLNLLQNIRLDGQSIDFEILCINDGSADDTLALLSERAQQDKRIKVLGLSRNFGKEAALSAGLDFCCGDAAIPIDADLQDPPEIIPQMLKLWHEFRKTERPFHIILPIRKQRKADSALKRSTAALFYHLMEFLSDSPIPKQASDFRLLDRKAIDAITAMREKNRFMKGILSWPGFRTKTIFLQSPSEEVRKSKAKLCQIIYSGTGRHFWLFGQAVKGVCGARPARFGRCICIDAPYAYRLFSRCCDCWVSNDYAHDAVFERHQPIGHRHNRRIRWAYL